MPLRHIRIVVIWEGNYNPDNFNIGSWVIFLKWFFLKNFHPPSFKKIIYYYTSQVKTAGKPLITDWKI